MFRYAISRLLTYIPLLAGLSVVVFLYVHIIPGDPVQAMAGPEVSPAAVEAIRHELGLDRPLGEQYFSWLENALKGDLGVTFRSRQKITPILLDRIPATLELAGAGLLVAMLLGIPAGLLAGLNKNTRIDYFFSLIALTGLSMPVFWLGTLIMLFLGLHLKILPSQGYIPFSENPQQNLVYLFMPAVTIGLGMAPFMARMSRALVVETMQEPFVAFARAKGLAGRTILVRYVLRHAVCQLVVIIAMDMGRILGGQILIEELFLWPGMGRLSARAVLERDYFMMQACILIFAAVFMLVNLAADLIHAYLDPRVQLR